MTARRFNRDAWREASTLHNVRHSAALLLAGLGTGWLGVNAIAGHWQPLVAAGALAAGVAALGRKPPKPSEYFEDVHLTRDPEGVDEADDELDDEAEQLARIIRADGFEMRPEDIREAVAAIRAKVGGRFLSERIDELLDEVDDDGDDVDKLLDEDLGDVTEETTEPPGPRHGRREIRINYTAEWTESVFVEVHEDASPYDAHELAWNAVSKHKPAGPQPHNIDDNEPFWRWKGPRPGNLRIPDDAWIELNGHRYATDGRLLVREDCPLPTLDEDPAARPPQWIIGDRRPKPDEVAIFLVPSEERHPGCFPSEYLPILTGRQVRSCNMPQWSGRDPFACALNDAGEVVAAFGPMRDGSGVFADGTPCRDASMYSGESTPKTRVTR